MSQKGRPLTAWQRVQLARHPERPLTLDYIKLCLTDFVELRGDRLYHDDHAIVAGLARLDDRTVAVVGHQKGRNTAENVDRNFGAPQPDGFRKALRIMKLAEKFGYPIISFIDTPGAAPDRQAEERGQAKAIADNLLAMAGMRVPIIGIVIGEGNSGGALAIGLVDRLLMMEHAYFSVVSPEGCASILWRDPKFAPQAAEAMRITSFELKQLGIIDEIILEPSAGAHTDHIAAAFAVKKAILAHLHKLERLSVDELLEKRFERYREIGSVVEPGAVLAAT